ncbi:restriction endonuclease subunit S [Microcystis aeruginosa]|uniref:restriction endonuclease subunit S n=1 Tax=Microcystis aeruginosa TaxID=1126 RepID=UPI00232AE247|nr:restriction endonuclease subunit S [Microcystis aeruginosa]MDB9413214.1 restriction endonuclease subunit S [Microcystis aeruginosa CS-567/02]
MSEWKTQKLGEVCKIEKKKYNGSNLAYVGMEDIESNTGRFLGYKIPKSVKSSTFKFTSEHILYGRLRPYLNKVMLPDFEGHCSSEIFPIKVSKELDRSFLFYWLTQKKIILKIDETCTGTRMPRANMEKVLNFSLVIPPIEEQKRIVEILDKAFEGIAQAEANTRRNLINARELFDSYLNQVFTNYAHHYNFISLNNLTELITKGSSPKWQGINYVEHPGVLFVTSENVGVNELIFEKTKYVEEKFNKKDSKSILKKGDVLTNIVGASIGRTAIFTREETANINQAVCLIRCLPDKLFNQYICYMLNSPYFRKILHENEVNTARANLSLTFFRNLEIPVPTLEEQKNIVNRISKTIQKTQKLETIYQRKLEAIAELKQSILEKAFTGQLSQ